jgi:predicted HAD superfamily phosphohydrolase YqeG
VRSLTPSYIIKDIADIDVLAFIKANPTIKAITWDLDKTLAGQHESTIPFKNIAIIKLFADNGMWQGFVSNAWSEIRNERVIRIASDIERIIEQKFAVATIFYSQCQPKPSTQMFKLMAEKAGLSPNAICHVGDQILKDILGGNRAEYGATILVAPFGRGDSLLVRIFQRIPEAILRLFMGLPLLVRNFPEQLHTL